MEDLDNTPVQDLDEIDKLLEPEVILTPDDILKASPLQAFFEEIKLNPRKYNDRQTIDKIFELSKVVYDQCWEARLQQTAEVLFNQVALGFTILTRILLARHNVQVQVQAGPGVPPQGGPPLPQGNLIQL